MTIKQFIEKAIEGGAMGDMQGHTPDIAISADGDFILLELGGNRVSISLHKFLLDPLAWQAVRGAEDVDYEGNTKKKYDGILERLRNDVGEDKFEKYQIEKWSAYSTQYQWDMQAMINALCEGNSLEDYIETL